jgi:hypothetical protein
LASCLQRANYDMTRIDVEDWIASQRFGVAELISVLQKYCRNNRASKGFRTDSRYAGGETRNDVTWDCAYRKRVLVDAIYICLSERGESPMDRTKGERLHK